MLYELERSSRFTCVMRPPTLDVLVEYHGFLGRYDLTANERYAEMEEAWYPIDLSCADTLVDTTALDTEGEHELSDLRGERPDHLWEVIAAAVWPGYRTSRRRAAAEPPQRSDLLGAMRALWDLQHHEEQFRLVIVTDNSD